MLDRAPTKMIDELYWTALSRAPEPQNREPAVCGVSSETKDRRRAWRIWPGRLLNSQRVCVATVIMNAAFRLHSFHSRRAVAPRRCSRSADSACSA